MAAAPVLESQQSVRGSLKASKRHRRLSHYILIRNKMAKTEANGAKLAKWSKIVKKSFNVGGHWIGLVG